MNPIRNIRNIFDRFEDKTRHKLSKHPAFFALIGGFSVVLFWRGTWMFFDLFDFMTPVVSIIISSVVMLATGTFISFFIGEQIIMSGIKKEKRIDQKTEKDLEEEELQVKFILAQISDIKTGVEEIRSLLGERKHEKVKTDKANSNEVKSYLISRKKLNK